MSELREGLQRARDALETCVRAMEQWYVQDQGPVIGAAAARRAAHSESGPIRQAVSAISNADRLLGPRAAQPPEGRSPDASEGGA